MLVKPEMLRGSGIYRSPFPLLTGVTMSTGNGRGWDSASGSESSDLRSGIHRVQKTDIHTGLLNQNQTYIQSPKKHWKNLG